MIPSGNDTLYSGQWKICPSLPGASPNAFTGAVASYSSGRSAVSTSAEAPAHIASPMNQTALPRYWRGRL